ncbi:MAG TPA: 16S rRNA (adenine(1518)-N(6)/adenine(1519)-N(6))-dimethyltransferase RsmA [Gemmataceae bacterium]|nr:16S rRNA (adenine(1518)-N(6)/adenine(1519)-N(6))-dimethyltransferase RsmA [Gemmataceae bacterium]
MSDDSAPRQTLSYVKGLLASRGILPKNKLGQNFLIDLNLIDLVVRTAELTATDLVLEVGTGTGSLTNRLADGAGAVVSVELDPVIYDMAREVIGERDNVRLLHADALRNKNELNPVVLSAVTEMHDRFATTYFKLVANLPYAVATPVISNLLLGAAPIERMVVTVQWEIAERLTAGVGTSPYGALSVLVQSLADVEIVRRLAPAVFWPRPQVESAIVLIRPDAGKRANVGDMQRFRHFLRDLYVHRRKNLRGALAGWPSGRRDKAEVDAKLAALGLPGTTRAEDLDVEQHLRLCAAFGD